MGSFLIGFSDAEIVHCWYCRLNLRSWKRDGLCTHHKEMSWACGIFWTQNHERKYIKCIMQQVLLSERQYHFIFLYNVMAFVMCVSVVFRLFPPRSERCSVFWRVRFWCGDFVVFFFIEWARWMAKCGVLGACVNHSALFVDYWIIILMWT